MLGCSPEEADAFVDAYHKRFPEVGPLISSVESAIRRRHRQEGCGYVRTMLGRRRRYPDLDRLHSGLNAFIQGSAADIAKIKARQLYDARKDLELTLRFVVHDSNEGDVPSVEHARKVQNLLNEPALPGLKVPVLWNTGVGPSWGQVNDLPTEMAVAA
jgi:DNA polymerase I-like protein with 3'-5' exonuclease and polymerase domains